MSREMRIGDPFPIVPVSHFIKDGSVRMEDAWQLVGPTIHRNHKRNFQDLLCIAFIEGMRMAVNALEDPSTATSETDA